MSDFGSNIFDENEPGAAKQRPRRAQREQPPPLREAPADEPLPDEPLPDEPLPDEPPSVDDVETEDTETTVRPQSHDEATAPEPRSSPGPEREERHERRPRHEERPRPDERARHEERPRYGSDRPPHDRPRTDEPPRHDERPRHEHPRRDERPRYDEPRPEPRHETRHQSYPPQQRDAGRGHDDRRPERDAPRHDRPFREERPPHHERSERSPRDRPHHERPYEPRGEDRPAPARAPAPPAPAAREIALPTAPGTVALLIDLVALQAQAQAQGGELAFRRLRDGLAGSRTVDRAFCFAPAGTTPPAGFDLAPSQDTLVGGIRFAAKALDLLGRSGEIVLAPPSEAMRELANTLRKAGHRVELAGFPAEGEETPGTRRLGRDCLFVP